MASAALLRAPSTHCTTSRVTSPSHPHLLGHPLASSGAFCLSTGGLKGAPGASKEQSRPSGLVCRSEQQSERPPVSPFRVTRRQATLTAGFVLWGAASRPDAASAGILSGSSGLESIPSPTFPLPGTELLQRMTEAQRQKYTELDEKFKSSPLLLELLKKSEENKERNQAIIQNKYCERGSEWGVGDCSLQGLSKEDKEAFQKALKEAQSKQ